MAFWCRCFIIVLISFPGTLSISRFLIGCSWIAHLTPVVMGMRRLTFQPVDLSVWMSGLYFAVIYLFIYIWAIFGNLSWQYVIFARVGIRGGGVVVNGGA